MDAHGILNACPYYNGNCGQIISAFLYEKGNKIDEKKKDITEIFQDWAYVSQIKYKTNQIVLGSATDLSIVRSMLPSQSLKRIEREEECRF